MGDVGDDHHQDAEHGKANEELVVAAAAGREDRRERGVGSVALDGVRGEHG
jgi:hypothetical protein